MLFDLKRPFFINNFTELHQEQKEENHEGVRGWGSDTLPKGAPPDQMVHFSGGLGQTWRRNSWCHRSGLLMWGGCWTWILMRLVFHTTEPELDWVIRRHGPTLHPPSLYSNESKSWIERREERKCCFTSGLSMSSLTLEVNMVVLK